MYPLSHFCRQRKFCSVPNNSFYSSVMVARSFSSFLQINSSSFFTPCSRKKYHIPSAQYCHTKILPASSYHILPVNHFTEDNFLCPVMDAVHSLDPSHSCTSFTVIPRLSMILRRLIPVSRLSINGNI